MSSLDTMGDHYELSKDFLGRGAFGVVRKARSVKTGTVCAIKQVVQIFEQVGMARRVLREMRVLSMMDHRNLVTLLDLKYQGEALYFITECCETDLHQLIHRDKKLLCANSINISARVRIMHHVLLGLQHLHSYAIVHRDIKPSNILITSNLEAKICDFGLARQISAQNADMTAPHDETSFYVTNDPMTPYVVTRWYRAPEVVITEGAYQLAQDIWASGCVFAEMMSGKVLFPGEDTFHQLHLIVAGLGRPTFADMNFPGINRSTISWFKSLSDSKECLAEKLRSPYWDDLQESNPVFQQLFLQLMRGVLQFNPQNRLSASKALAYPLFEAMGQPGDLPPEEEFSADQGQLQDIEACPPSRRALKDLVVAEAQHIQMQRIWRDVHEKDELSRRITLSRDSLESQCNDSGHLTHGNLQRLRISPRVDSASKGLLHPMGDSACTTQGSIDTELDLQVPTASSLSDTADVVMEDQECAGYHRSPEGQAQAHASVDTDDDCEVAHDFTRPSHRPNEGVLAKVRNSVDSLAKALMRPSSSSVEGGDSAKRKLSLSIRRLDGCI